jgi:hypothetical protein
MARKASLNFNLGIEKYKIQVTPLINMTEKVV